ncbi:protein enhancer of sevenless 2B-like [Mizuhopecten yessoensis]|uniref:protein enhancer of sevenless 2B-like n=1 Tax=Mizuhopecten yessoensis TaxID=6573 RepID=UPI000B45CF5A|nr:protein enhancer of sevenless 2B-like [Mizuhopecten yessoensis]
MEARAKHDFKATAEDELSFSRNVTLKITDTKKDANWFKAEICGKEGFIPNNYIEWKSAPWYLGDVRRLQAEEMLTAKDGNGAYLHPDGAFLVRNSESQQGEFSLSVKTGEENVQHFKILRDGRGNYFLWVQKFASINELVEYHRGKSISRSQNMVLKDMTQTDLQLKDEVQLRALYDFEAQNSDEISFTKGDIIIKTGENCTNWWRGILSGSSKEGLFPAAYVYVMDTL